jgi:4-diphosphocytidyl-2-C-methyl-D-erythritol kinase
LTIKTHCYAKVNLTLEVLGRRADGYHELCSLVRTIDLADELRVEPSDTLEVGIDGHGLADETNLVVKAAGALADASGSTRGARLLLRKHIPDAAGLGGGSSDAASTLVALDQLWGTHLGREQLHDLALKLGSDVPFFLTGGQAIVRGRGERVEPQPAQTGLWLVLLVPRHRVERKTASLFAALHETDFSDGQRSLQVAAHLNTTGQLDDCDLVNAFERPARTVFEGLTALWQSAEQRSGRTFHLSGAGPTLFAIAAYADEARAIAAAVQPLGERVIISATVDAYAGPLPIQYA